MVPPCSPRQLLSCRWVPGTAPTQNEDTHLHLSPERVPQCWALGRLVLQGGPCSPRHLPARVGQHLSGVSSAALSQPSIQTGGAAWYEGMRLRQHFRKPPIFLIYSFSSFTGGVPCPVTPEVWCGTGCTTGLQIHKTHSFPAAEVKLTPVGQSGRLSWAAALLSRLPARHKHWGKARRDLPPWLLPGHLHRLFHNPVLE